MKSWLKIAAAAAFAIGSLSGRASAQANLIVNGSFELPSIPAGAFLAVGTGSTEITGWAVINQFGGTGNVALVDSTFAASSFEFPAQDGAQWLNLTDFTGNFHGGTIISTYFSVDEATGWTWDGVLSGWSTGSGAAPGSPAVRSAAPPRAVRAVQKQTRFAMLPPLTRSPPVSAG